MKLILLQIVSGLLGCLVYHLRRYNPKLSFGFVDYLRYELGSLLQGIIGFLGIYIVWQWGQPLIDFAWSVTVLVFPSLAGRGEVELMPLNIPICFILGLIGKTIYVTIPRVKDYIRTIFERRIV